MDVLDLKDTKHKMHKAQIKTKSTNIRKHKRVCVFRGLGSVFYLCFGSCVLCF